MRLPFLMIGHWTHRRILSALAVTTRAVRCCHAPTRALPERAPSPASDRPATTGPDTTSITVDTATDSPGPANTARNDRVLIRTPTPPISTLDG
jgi:hypothetical protein